MIKRFVIALMLVVIAAAATAQQTADRIEAAWREWVPSVPATRSTLVVLHQGAVVRSLGIGAEPGAVMPLASLSKPLTAACYARLVGEDFDETIGDVLGRSGELADVTAAELVTHTAGIWPDATQNNAALALATEPMISEVVDQVFWRQEQQGQRGEYAYNNENYALLGAMIEQVTGEAYGPACTRAVLAPAGAVTARLDGRWAGMGSWGGWSMSAPDYARVMWRWFGPQGPVGADPQAWPMAPLDARRASVMGVNTAMVEGKRLFWGAGQLCWNGRGDGGYFGRYGPDYLVVVLHDACLAGTDGLARLDRVLFDAAME